MRDAIETDYRRQLDVPGAAHEPHRGRRSRRFHDRRADGLRQAVGRPVVPRHRAPRARARRRSRDRVARRRARRGEDPRSRSTSRTSTRPTTSTATSRTTTCGRRSSRGTRPSTTAWPASGSTLAIPSTKSVFNDRKAMPAAADRHRPRHRRRPSSWCRTTTSRGSRSRSSKQACRDRGGAVATLAFDSRRYVGAQIGIHSPAGNKVGKVSHLRNVEYVVCAGEQSLVDHIANKGDELWKLPATSRS